MVGCDVNGKESESLVKGNMASVMLSFCATSKSLQGDDAVDEAAPAWRGGNG